MDRLKLERCTNVEEIAKELWRQNYKISEIDGECGKYDEGKLYGFYLKPIKNVVNTSFDIYFKICSDVYCRTINEFDEGRRYDGAVMAYEVLLLWLNGKYTNFKYIPSTCEEFIEMIFDKDKAQEITKYLVGVVQRLTRNALYCSREKSSISETKYWTHDAERQYYTDVIKVDIDRPYEYGQDGGFETNSHRILDEFLLKENKSTSIKSVEDELFAIDEEECGVYRYLYNNLLSQKNRVLVDESKTDGNTNYYIRKKLDNKIDRYNAIVLDENKRVIFGGNFLDFGYEFMVSSRLNKFNTIKEILKNNNITSDILIDCIYNIDMEIIKEFVYILKINDIEKIESYCNSENFGVIIDSILNEYFIKQNRLKEMYLFGECERLEKIELVEEYIRGLERKDGVLLVMDINKIFTYTLKVYQLRLENKYTKTELKDVSRKLEVLYELGFVFEEVKNKVYKCI